MATEEILNTVKQFFNCLISYHEEHDIIFIKDARNNNYRIFRDEKLISILSAIKNVQLVPRCIS
jgi:hypothetical protein